MTRSTHADPAAEAWPHCLLDHVLRRQRLKNDAELSRRLLLAPSSISKIRRGRCGVSAEVMLRVHEAFDIPIAELKQLEAAHQAALRQRGA